MVQQLGPLTPRQLKAETGLLNKQIMPALHRLQQAFLVYEDQTDSDWERAWYDMASEWPDLELNPADETATREVVLRVVQNDVFITFEQLTDWAQLPAKRLREAVVALEDSRAVVPLAVAGLGEGWIRADLRTIAAFDTPRGVWMLHKADPLVRSHASELKRRFGGLETLQYLLIDGAFSGAVCGHWRISAHDVEDIALDLPRGERDARRAEILAAVAAVYQPPGSRILRYAGRATS